jgi:hypothetical protein
MNAGSTRITPTRPTPVAPPWSYAKTASATMNAQYAVIDAAGELDAAERGAGDDARNASVDSRTARGTNRAHENNGRVAAKCKAADGALLTCVCEKREDFGTNDRLVNEFRCKRHAARGGETSD